MEYVNIHTHRPSNGIYILDISDGKPFQAGEYCSFGIHPKYIKTGDNTEQILRLAKESKIVALGEAGLDMNAPADILQQKGLFEAEVMISEAYGLPMILHCVKAYSELIAIRKRLHPLQPWIIHGYNNNEQLLLQLLQHGLYISAGKALLYEKSNIRNLLAQIPLERLFLETDDADVEIENVYQEAALLLGIQMEELERIMLDNFRRCFGDDKKNVHKI